MKAFLTNSSPQQSMSRRMEGCRLNIHSHQNMVTPSGVWGIKGVIVKGGEPNGGYSALDANFVELIISTYEFMISSGQLEILAEAGEATAAYTEGSATSAVLVHDDTTTYRMSICRIAKLAIKITYQRDGLQSALST